MKRFSILVKEYGSDREVELCQLDRNPQDIGAALGRKTLRISSGGRDCRIPKYTWIRVVDHDASTVPHHRGKTAGECRHSKTEKIL
jgi:hypothetical protein